ncbi:MAG: hypothetical protein C4520_03730 [Candidatus Abyssobacteria bacterium SURF_5]|uniref:Lipoprotein n=1 Tax=Abyssobacteria bacterium (strain SURF_5) TaxID=2093360 RepID=A0A3A4P9P4_ABYX5|nr:MAG: hypothetical protein C4520_03730 [Candidatus Abyssubacteria bacterium SURF_5]
MKLRKKYKAAAIILTALFCLVAGGCSSTGVYIGDEPPVVKTGGPPPHAPAHGYRAKYAYYYYPEGQVYFDLNRNVYFYMDAGAWRMSASLPTDLNLQLGKHVRIDMDTSKPYTYFEQHKVKYPPGQAKKKNGKK